MNVTADLIGRPVLEPITARLHGWVKNVVVGHSSPANWLAVFWQTPGGNHEAALRQHCQLLQQPEAVLVPQRYVVAGKELAERLNEVASAQLELRFDDFTKKGANHETNDAENLANRVLRGSVA